MGLLLPSSTTSRQDWDQDAARPYRCDREVTTQQQQHGSTLATSTLRLTSSCCSVLLLPFAILVAVVPLIVAQDRFSCSLLAFAILHVHCVEWLPLLPHKTPWSQTIGAALCADARKDQTFGGIVLAGRRDRRSGCATTAGVKLSVMPEKRFMHCGSMIGWMNKTLSIEIKCMKNV